MNIVLTGPMGSGKTSTGIGAAKLFGMEFVDTDNLVEERAGKTISDIFASEGEEHFRSLEKEIVSEIAAKDNLVIATGGGVVLDPANMRALRRNGVIINLRASVEILCERLENVEDRPLLGSRDRREYLEKYLEVRRGPYANTDFVIDTGAEGLSEVVKQVCDIAKQPRIRICGCVCGNDALEQIRYAMGNGASMIELRLDLISSPDIPSLVRSSGLPIIATDRKNKDNLVKAIEAGCEVIDVEIDSPQRDSIIELAKKNDCKVIVSLHDHNSTPDVFPKKGGADLLKIATKVNTEGDLHRLLDLLHNRDDLIVIGMGEKGTSTRLDAPILGSYLTYCSLGKETAPGQLSLDEMISEYKRRGLR